MCAMCDALARSGLAGLGNSARACSAASWSEASDAHLRSFFQAYRRSLTASSSSLATRTCAPPRPARVRDAWQPSLFTQPRYLVTHVLAYPGKGHVATRTRWVRQRRRTS